MPEVDFLPASLEALLTLTQRSHRPPIADPAEAVWRHHLRADNPLWPRVTARPFVVAGPDGPRAHVLALVDRRLPSLGLAGFFGCTDPAAGVQVLDRASAWLRDRFSLSAVYGPINGTITRDYRLNLTADYKIPGEPVNPAFYPRVFEQAGFQVFNRYLSGRCVDYRTLVDFFCEVKPPPSSADYRLRPFGTESPEAELRTYHGLMNGIFPASSIYCPRVSLAERRFNLGTHKPRFDPRYSYFLDDRGQPVGFVVGLVHRSQLVIKTLGLLPSHRHLNLSTLLIKRVHDQAAADGLGAAIYSTVRAGNAIDRRERPGVEIYRHYVTMRRDLRRD